MIRRIRISLTFLACTLFFSACSAHEPKFEPSDVQAPVEMFINADTKYTIDAYDPLEGLNRRIYAFNTVLDRSLLIPLVNGYQFITPIFLQKGITNFFNNIDEMQNFFNAFLQLDANATGTALGRFAINTTIGVAGLFDPATSFGLNVKERDFGQTLGRYGVGPGAYLVLPLLGPSTVRDGFGRAVDIIPYSTINPISLQSLLEDDEWIYYTLLALRTLDARANFDFRYYQSGSPFEYDIVRLLYLSDRKIKIKNVRMKDNFSKE